MALVGMKSVTITDKGQIAIPKELRESKGFRNGTKVAVLFFDDRIELWTMKKYEEKMATALASEKSLAKDWLSKEDEDAWKDL